MFTLGFEFSGHPSLIRMEKELVVRVNGFLIQYEHAVQHLFIVPQLKKDISKPGEIKGFFSFLSFPLIHKVCIVLNLPPCGA